MLFKTISTVLLIIPYYSIKYILLNNQFLTKILQMIICTILNRTYYYGTDNLIFTKLLWLKKLDNTRIFILSEYTIILFCFILFVLMNLIHSKFEISLVLKYLYVQNTNYVLFYYAF